MQLMRITLTPTCLQSRNTLNHGQKLLKNFCCLTKRKRRRKCDILSMQSAASLESMEKRTRIYITSDLHTDYRENMEWVEGLSYTKYCDDVLITAGDVADCLETFKRTMSLLNSKFQQVFVVPGNHDLWCRKENDPSSSLEKLEVILKWCKDEGIHTEPKKINNVWIVPIYSWHHQSFDKEKDIVGYKIPSLDQVCMDYRVCKWPSNFDQTNTSIAEYFDEMNKIFFDELDQIDFSESHLVSFSHFVPRQELCPEKRMLLYPNLPKVIGSDWLEKRIRLLHRKIKKGKSCHVFGHTHFAWDSVIEDIRYIQAPLAYPKERQRGINGGENWLPLKLYDSTEREFIRGPIPSSWAEYYRENLRDPSITTLAPWVANRYKVAKSVTST